MSASGLELREIRVKGIRSLIDDPSIWDQEHFASTKHRLLVFLRNPKADPDDIVLLIAFLDGRMIGYMGAFADVLATSAGLTKINWLHSWWIDPNYREIKVGLKVFERMYEIQQGRIGASQFTPAAGRVYFKSNKFTVVAKMDGLKVAFLLDIAEKLRAKSKLGSIAAVPFRMGEVIFNFFTLAARKLALKIRQRQYSLEYVSGLDAETVEFLKAHSPAPVCSRGSEFFEWLFHYQVMINMPLRSTAQGKYYFSYKAKSFGFFYVKVFSKSKELVGFVVLQERDRLLKVLYSFQKETHHDLVTRVVLDHAVSLGCSTMITYENAIVSSLPKHRLGYLYARKKTKEALISKEFGSEDQWAGKYFHYGDGDCCFA